MNRNKSIYLIYEFLSEQGGLEREIISHAKMLKEEGFKVKILTCHLDKKILNYLPFENLKIEVLPIIHTKFEIINLALCAFGLHNLKKYNPDIFLVYSFPSNFLIRNKKTKKVNYLNHFLHAYYMPWRDKIKWATGTQGIKRWISILTSLFLSHWLIKLDKELVRNNNLKFANSKFTKKRIDKIYEIDSIVSYPPLDVRFNNLSKKKINQKYIFSSSRIIPDKKYELLINSMKYLKNKIPLYIAGYVKNSYKKNLTILANKNKVTIKFLGKLNTNQIKDYYTNAEVFAFPTPEEDFGLVPAEAMSCGTPVVVWGDGAGPTEQVIDGLTGFYAKPYDVKDFAKKIDLIINSRMKIKNKTKIIKGAKRFSYDEIKRDFINEINKIIKN